MWYQKKKKILSIFFLNASKNLAAAHIPINQPTTEHLFVDSSISIVFKRTQNPKLALKEDYGEHKKGFFTIIVRNPKK